MRVLYNKDEIVIYYRNGNRYPIIPYPEGQDLLTFSCDLLRLKVRRFKVEHRDLQG